MPEDLANFSPCSAEGYKTKGLFNEVDTLLREDIDVLEALSQIFDPRVVSYRWASPFSRAQAHVRASTALLLRCTLCVLSRIADSHLHLPLRRQLMSNVAKEAGTEYVNKSDHRLNHERALERYSLAYALDNSNIAALSNRAKTHLSVSRPFLCLQC